MVERGLMFVVPDSLKLALEYTEVMSVYSFFLLMVFLNSTVYIVWLCTSFPTSFSETKEILRNLIYLTL